MDLVYLPPFQAYHRALYDTDYLDADCNATRVPLNEENGVDSSVATFTTNYLLAAVTLAYAVALVTRRGKDAEGATLSMAIFFGTTGLAFGIAGVGHQLTTEQEELANQIILRIVAFSGNVGNYALLRVLILYYTKFEGCARIVWWMVSVPLTIYATIVTVDNSAATGIPAFLVTLGLLITFIWQYRKDPRRAFLLKVVGLIFLVIGGLVQLLLAPLCGFDAYPDCFEDCPLPAPDFNHNALFHVLAWISYAILGYGEVQQLPEDSLSVLRRPVTEDTTDSVHEP